jgi:hypothetical protein
MDLCGTNERKEQILLELLAIEINDKREGRLILQPKHKLAKSPDMADACALTMCKEGTAVPHRRSHLTIRPMFS